MVYVDTEGVDRCPGLYSLPTPVADRSEKEGGLDRLGWGWVAALRAKGVVGVC